MRVTGHNDVEVVLRRACQLALQCAEPFEDQIHFIAQIKPHVQSHLIVTASCRMQFAPRRTNHLGQAPFDVHVDVFVRARKSKLARVDLALDFCQPVNDLASVALGNDALLGEHLGMRDAAHDVVAVKPRVDGDGRGKRFHRIRRARAEAPAPKFFLGGSHAH
jgi:hypothetical protein